MLSSSVHEVDRRLGLQRRTQDSGGDIKVYERKRIHQSYLFLGIQIPI
jgi:hypothetical protein